MFISNHIWGMGDIDFEIMVDVIFPITGRTSPCLPAASQQTHNGPTPVTCRSIDEVGRSRRWSSPLLASVVVVVEKWNEMKWRETLLLSANINRRQRVTQEVWLAAALAAIQWWSLASRHYRHSDSSGTALDVRVLTEWGPAFRLAVIQWEAMLPSSIFSATK